MTAFLLMVFCILRNTTAQDLQATCPTGGFIEGQKSQVNCSVNRLYFDNQCLSTPSVVLFVFKPSGGSDLTWCSTEYQNCASTGTSSSWACNNCTCKCLEDTTNTFVYSLTFVPESRYTNGSLSCEIPCFGTPPATDFTSCEKFPVVNKTSTTPGDTESRSSSTLVIGLAVAGGVCVVMAAVGFYCFRKRRPGGQNDAPPANAPPANAPRDNAAPDNAPLDNAAPDNAPPDNAAPDNGPQGADTAGASTDQTVPTTPGAELDESSVAGSEASEASEGTEDTASQISEV
ncbi:uncharacterized protein [Littorina saxatilis]|uniref:uncharacterized protein isoform X2 n=1 Tax=Littorina saxatilis TaxID=31220 RepID=UPI0038B48DFE